VVSGLDMAIKVLSKIEDLGFSYLTGQDVVRHPLVQKIVKAYDAYEERQKRNERTVQGHKVYSKIKKGMRAEKIRSNRYESR
jgi:phosphate starvation-inducible PhoH-like protein